MNETTKAERVDTSRRRFIDRVQEIAGCADAEQSLRIAQAVLVVLAEQLAAHERAWLAHLLPAGLSLLSARDPAEQIQTLQQFNDRVAARESVAPGFAAEHTQSVCRALSETLDDEQLTYLVHRLPDALATLFARRDSEQTSTRNAGEQPKARHSVLAEGKPGSQHPLSESAPERAHRASVARDENPHGDTKLSSSRGTTQEREAETLAEGRPGPQRPR